MKRTPKQCGEELKLRRKFAHNIVPESTVKEKETYITERDKQKAFDERQKDPKRLNKLWLEFCKAKGIKPEDLIIGLAPDEDELDMKADLWLKKVIAKMERYEPITDVKQNDNGTVTLTINPDLPRDLLFYELNKVLPSPSKERFRKESVKAFEVYDKWSKERTKPLSHIARELNIRYSTAKTRWRRAYFLIHEKKFIPLKETDKHKSKAYELCKKCNDAKCYKESMVNGDSVMESIGCAEYVALAGKSYQREKTMSTEQMAHAHFGEAVD